MELKNREDPQLWPLSPLRVRRDRLAAKKMVGAQVLVRWKAWNPSPQINDIPDELRTQRLAFRALVRDAKVIYRPFRTLLLVAPIAGKGEEWIPLGALDRFPDGKFYIFPNHPDWQSIESLAEGPKYNKN